MNWYFKVLGGHTHVRCFMNGAKCGDLVFRNEEFEIVRSHFTNQSTFVNFIYDET